jgi:glutamate dehydrogenase (NAD(P)+)
MPQNINLLDLSPQQFVEFLKNESIKKFHFVYDDKKKKMISSHIQLQSIADFLSTDTRDFMMHEGAFFQLTKKHDVLQGAFVHRTNRGQAAGGVRYWQYETMEDYLRDGLRLAKGMTRKNALAGLWWGGGKGVMAANPNVDKSDPKIREVVYKEYGELMSALKGCYVTAEDVGTNVADMANIFSKTRFTTCIPESLGGSGNPSVPTARGVVAGMEAAIEFLGEGDLEGKTIAIQGMGNVAEPLIKFLFDKKVKKIIAADIFPKVVENITLKYSHKNLEANVVGKNSTWIFEQLCDVLSPCATGAILNPKTIPLIKAKVICGAANNQLEDSRRDGLEIFNKGIIYVPDFLTNRMGIVNCANEDAGYVNNDPMFEQHLQRDWEFSIFKMTQKVLQKSISSAIPTADVALEMADKLSLENNPIFGHRGKLIIQSLVENKWFE